MSADESVHPAGTALPSTPFRAVNWRECVDAACAILRAPAAAIERRGPARTLAIETAWVHGMRDVRALATHARVDRTTVIRAVEGLPERGGKIVDPVLAASVRVVGDPRFRALEGGDLRHQWRNSRYAGLH